MAALTTIVGVTALAATAVSAVGSIAQGNQAAANAEAQSDLLEQEAETRGQEADRVRKQSELDADEFRRRESRTLAKQRTLFGASGVSLEGSPLLVGEQTASDIELQARKILVGGLTDANAIESGAAGLSTQASIARSKGSAAKTAGFVGAGSTLLAGGARAGDFFGG